MTTPVRKGVWSSGSTTVYNRRQGFGRANREGPKCETLYFSEVLEAIFYWKYPQSGALTN
jgi:hypothetical protein